MTDHTDDRHGFAEVDFSAEVVGPAPDAFHDDPVDGLLARRVADRFADDPDLGGGHVGIRVQNRVVILTGRVGHQGARAAAGRVAWAVPGVFDVCNRLLPA